MKYSFTLFVAFLLCWSNSTETFGKVDPLNFPAKITCINLTDVLIANENCGMGNGTITLIHDGTTPFSYTWSHSATLNDSIATGLSAGTYNVQISDNAGCTADTTVTLTNTPLPTATLDSQMDLTCAGGSDGSATLSLGDPAYLVSWDSNPVQDSSVLVGVPAGTYTATVSDTFGCSITISVTLTEPSPFQVTGSVTPDTCGAPNGSATVMVVPGTGGTTPFTYQWDSLANNQTTPTATNLVNGSYEVVVTDANGCNVTYFTPLFSVINGFDGTVSSLDTKCYGDSSGIALVSPEGGNGQYSYIWTAENDTIVLGTDSVLMDVPTGTYTISMSDALGNRCNYVETVIVGQPDSVKAELIIEQTSDCGLPDGYAVADPSGGMAPYTYLWSNGDTGDTTFNLLPGFYSLTVTDTLGCVNSTNFVMTSSTGPEFEVEVLQEDSCGIGTGIARVRITVGTAPYQVIWNTNSPQTSDSSIFAFNLFRTDNPTYSAVVIDADSCFGRRTFSVPGNDPLEVVNTATEVNYCDLANGSAAVEITGGSQPYRYLWTTNPPQTSSTALGLIEGSYEVTIRDSLNCVIDTSFVITEEAGFTLEVESTDITCNDDEDGQATAIVTGEKGALSYEWTSSPTQTSATASNLPSGTYNVTVRDEEGCEREDFAVISPVHFLEANFTTIPDSLEPTILGDNSYVFINESIGAEEYLWKFGDGNFSTEAAPVHVYADTGYYNVTLIAYNNGGTCIDSTRLGPFIIVRDGVVFVPDAFTPNGDGFNDLFIIRGELIENYQLRIFSRWGQQVFESSSIVNSWDGRRNGGTPVPQGVYVYTLTATAAGNKDVVKTGTVTVFR